MSESKIARQMHVHLPSYLAFRHSLLYQCLCFGFLVLSFCDLAQIFRAIQAIQEEDAIQVIDLMLEDTRKPALCANTDRFTPRILPFYNHAGRTPDIITDVAGNT